MSDLPPPASSSVPPDEGNPFVIEHYGFAATPAGAAAPQAARDGVPAGRRAAGDESHRPQARHRGVLVAAAMSLALVAGVGGVAAAATRSGPDGGGADRPGTTSLVGRDAGGPGVGPGGGDGRGAGRGPDGDRGRR